MLKLGIDPEKLYRATFICQDGLCCCNMALISFRLFRKNWATCEIFLGKWFTASPGKKFPVRLWLLALYEVVLIVCQSRSWFVLNGPGV